MTPAVSGFVSMCPNLRVRGSCPVCPPRFVVPVSAAVAPRHASVQVQQPSTPLRLKTRPNARRQRWMWLKRLGPLLLVSTAAQNFDEWALTQLTGRTGITPTNVVGCCGFHPSVVTISPGGTLIYGGGDGSNRYSLLFSHNLSSGPSTSAGTLVAGADPGSGDGGADGTLTTATFGMLGGLVARSDTTFLVADLTNHNIRWISIDTNTVTTVVSLPAPAPTEARSPAVPARHAKPRCRLTHLWAPITEGA